MTTRPETGDVGDLLRFEQFEIVQEEVLPVVTGSAEDMFAQMEEVMAGNVTNIDETDVGNVTNIDETDVGNVTNIDETDVGNVTNIDEATVGMRPAESDVDMRPTYDDDDMVLNYNPSSDEEDEDVIMTSEPEITEISDIVGDLAHKNYFVQLCDGNYYHYPTDKIYTLSVVRSDLEEPMLWKRVTDSVYENAEVAPLIESGFQLHFNSGKIYSGNARVDRYRGVNVKALCSEFKVVAPLHRQVSQRSKVVVNLKAGMKPAVESNVAKRPEDSNIGKRPIVDTSKKGASCCSSDEPEVKRMLDAKEGEGLKPSTSKLLPTTMDIMIHGHLIKARIMKTGHSYMNAQLVQQLRKGRYAKGINVTDEPLNVQEVGFVVEGLSVDKLATAGGLTHLLQKDGKNYKPVEIFFTLFTLCPPGRETWSSNKEEPLVGLSLYDVSVANVISENVLAKGPKAYPITLKTDQGMQYAMALSLVNPRLDDQVMGDIQLKNQSSVRDRVGLSNSGKLPMKVGNSEKLPTMVRLEMLRDEWDQCFGDTDWQLKNKVFKNSTGYQMLQHLAADFRISFFGPGGRTKLSGKSLGQSESIMNVSQSGSVASKIIVEWDGNPMTLCSSIREITEMSMQSMPKSTGSFAGLIKVPDMTAEEARRAYNNIKQMLSVAKDQEPYRAILTMESTDIKSKDSISCTDPLAHSKVVCMLVSRFVSLHKKEEQYQRWSTMKQQADQTVKVFVTQIASMAAIGGYTTSTALLTIANGLTPKAIATGAKCRQLQITESQSESIEGTCTTIMNLLDVIVQEAYIYKEDVMLPVTIYDRVSKTVSRPMDPIEGKPVVKRKCMKCGQVGHRETVCINEAACNWCASKSHFRSSCPTAPRKLPVESSAGPTVAVTAASVRVQRGGISSSRGRGCKRMNEDS